MPRNFSRPVEPKSDRMSVIALQGRREPFSIFIYCSSHHSCMTTTTAQHHPADVQIQHHVSELLKLGWQFRGRGLYPTWGKGERIHDHSSCKTKSPLND